MKRRELIELVALAALWGASFLFMRMGAAEFGPVGLAAVRCGGASLLLLPWLVSRRRAPALRSHWRAIAWLGITNSALPFVCFGLAALAIDAGLSSIFNAATPLWAALIASLWLRERLTATRWLGLAIGIGGVAWLVWDRAAFKAGDHGVSAALAIAACLVATVLYGYSANYAKKRLAGIPSMALAAGSQLSAALVLSLPAWWLWPSVTPGAAAWTAAALLALLCTGLAYILYFRLIASAGATSASAVTFLIPPFAVLWGWMFLGETVTASMVAACAVILVGIALAMGLWPRRST
jgi:drug/metabolite transporter (DMT)-like permease